MFIKLTNAVDQFDGDPILINVSHIISVTEAVVNDKTITNIYSTTKENWNVKESIDQVYKLINKLK